MNTYLECSLTSYGLDCANNPVQGTETTISFPEGGLPSLEGLLTALFSKSDDPALRASSKGTADKEEHV